MSYHERRFMPFRPNDRCYSHIHGIVSSNDLILFISMHLGLANNVDEESFIFCEYIFHFSFSECQNGFFCEAHTKNMFPNWGATCFGIIRPYFI